MPLIPFLNNNADLRQKKLAVLIDADNAQAVNIEGLLDEVAKYGVASIKRIYGDWTNTRLNSWKQKLLEYAIQPMQQFSYTTGKNATDSAMIIDAMDLLYSEKLDGFCIVSSDSDFTRLAARIREAGLTVYGFGEKKTPRPFVTVCDKFIYTEILQGNAEFADYDENISEGAPLNVKKELPKKKASQKIEPKMMKVLCDAVDDMADDSGWANLASVGQKISNKAPEFDSRNYGFRKLGDMFRASVQFVCEERHQANGTGVQVYIKRK
jgi:uncharacterized LabA/DUF88 family protein